MPLPKSQTPIAQMIEAIDIAIITSRSQSFEIEIVSVGSGVLSSIMLNHVKIPIIETSPPAPIRNIFIVQSFLCHESVKGYVKFME